MSEKLFEILTPEAVDSSADETLSRLAGELREAGQYHELFDARLMQFRHRLGLGVDRPGNLEELPEPLRSQVEESYLEACREVGGLMVTAGRFREAWVYLRPVGDKTQLAQALAETNVDEKNLDELVELSLHEGVNPELGFRLVLGHYGTCNAITTLEGVMYSLPQETQRTAAQTLVRHLHGELLGNVRGHVEREEGKPPAEATLAELVAERPWLLENDSYHIDTSHLSSTVRFGRLLVDREPLQLALDLTEYGRRLSAALQFPGDEPFLDVYDSHRLLFAASLGEHVDEAVDHFGRKARELAIEEHGTGAVETYLILLTRLGRHAEAMEVWGELVPAGVQLSPYAPRPLEMARRAERIDRYLELCRQRNDYLSYAAALVESRTAASVG